MPAMNSLEDALYDEMKDILHAEKQLTRALPKMAKAAQNEQLRQAFEEHLEQTKQQVERLQKAMESLGRKATAKKCQAMEGILEEGKEIMEQEGDPDTLDAMLIGAAQKTEHYEIASYGTACTWAKQLGQTEALELMKQNLAEEEETDKKLTKLAKSLNRRAASGE